MNELLLTAMAAHGKVSFYAEGSGWWFCRWEIARNGQTSVTIASGATLSQALSEVLNRAEANGFIGDLPPLPADPRVITKVMTDGISTKDGCA